MRPISVMCAVAVLTCVPRVAAAQGFISPFVGTTLTSPTATGSGTKPGYGVALGGFASFIGGETEIAYYPEVVDNTANAISKNNVLTFSGNILVGPRIGAVKPYGAVGFGDLHLSVTSLTNLVQPTAATISSNYFTVNGGGGLFVFFSSHVGVRGDLRYYRSFGVKQTDLQSAGLALDKFDFWRAAGGLVFTF